MYSYTYIHKSHIDNFLTYLAILRWFYVVFQRVLLCKYDIYDAVLNDGDHQLHVNQDKRYAGDDLKNIKTI